MKVNDGLTYVQGGPKKKATAPTNKESGTKTRRIRLDFSLKLSLEEVLGYCTINWY